MSDPDISARYVLNVDVRLPEPLRIMLGTGEQVDVTSLTASWTDKGEHLAVTGTAVRGDGSSGKAKRTGIVPAGLGGLPHDLRTAIERARDAKADAMVWRLHNPARTPDAT